MGKVKIRLKCDGHSTQDVKSTVRLARLAFLSTAFLILSVLNSASTASISSPAVFASLEESYDEVYEDENCTMPGASNFPTDLFSMEARRHGAIVVHFLAVLYVFYAVLIICDEYFVPAVESICR